MDHVLASFASMVHYTLTLTHERHDEELLYLVLRAAIETAYSPDCICKKMGEDNH